MTISTGALVSLASKWHRNAVRTTNALNGTRMDGNKVTIKAMSLVSKSFCNFHAKMQPGFDSEIARPQEQYWPG